MFSNQQFRTLVALIVISKTLKTSPKLCAALAGGAAPPQTPRACKMFKTWPKNRESIENKLLSN